VFLTTKNRIILEHHKLVPYNSTVISEQDQDILITDDVRHFIKY